MSMLAKLVEVFLCADRHTHRCALDPRTGSELDRVTTHELLVVAPWPGQGRQTPGTLAGRVATGGSSRISRRSTTPTSSSSSTRRFGSSPRGRHGASSTGH